jgi:hypothetical protein
MNTNQVVKLTIVRCLVGNRPFTLAMHLPHVNGRPQVSPEDIKRALGYTSPVSVRIY